MKWFKPDFRRVLVLFEIGWFLGTLAWPTAGDPPMIRWLAWFGLAVGVLAYIALWFEDREREG